MHALTVLHSCEPNYEDATSYKNTKAIMQPKQETDVDCNAKMIKLKLHVTKSSNKVLFAEVEEDMVDLLISWLTFPLGLLIKHTKNLTDGCIVNLYKSVESCSYLKSEECKSLLLSPKLGAFHGCSSQLLEGEEMASETRNLFVYSSCYFSDGSSTSFPVSRNFEELNPKKLGDGYARELGKFIVTDDLRVLQLSLHSFVHILKEYKISASGLVEREATIGEAQVLENSYIY